MPNENDISGRVGLDITDFKTNISALNQQIKVIETGFKAAAAGMEDWGSNADGLQARIKSLTDVIGLQQQKVDNLKSMYAQIAAEKGESSRAAQDLQIKINKETEALNKNQAELKSTVSRLDNLGAEADSTGKDVKNLGDDFDKAGKKALSFGDVLKANVIGNVITDGLRAAGSAIQGFASDALESADSLQQMSDATGVSTERLQELKYIGEDLGVDLDTFSGAQAKLTKNMSSAKDGTGAQAEAFKALGISVLDSSGNLRDAKTVMFEAFDALGSVGNETERDALAISLFGKSAQDLNPLIKAGSDGLNELAQKARDTGAVMSGDTISALDSFGDTVDHLKQNAAAMAGTLLEKLLPSIQPIIDKIQTMDVTPIANFLGFILNNAGTIAAGLAAIGVGFVAFNVASMIQGVVTAFQAFKIAQEGATVAQWLMNAAMAANPVMIIVVAIAALVAGIIVLWNTNEGFRNAVIAVWEALKNGVGAAVTAIANFFTKTIPNALSALVNWFTALPGKIGGAIAGAITAIGAWAGNLIAKARTEIPKVITNIVSFFLALPGKLLDVGKNLITGLWNGISNKIEWLKSKISGFVGNVVSAIKNFFGIHSPSTVMAGIGGYLSEGLAVGITGKAGLVTAAMNKLNNQIQGSATINANVTASGARGGYGTATTNLYLDSNQILSATSPVQYSRNNTKARSLGVLLA